MHLVILAAMVLALSVLTTTREDRRQAREKMNRWARWLWIPNILFWGSLAIDLLNYSTRH